MKRKSFLILLLINIACFSSTFAQSKKEVKKHKIKSSSSVTTEDVKTINERKVVYFPDGEVAEESVFDNKGNLKKVRKLKYK